MSASKKKTSSSKLSGRLQTTGNLLARHRTLVIAVCMSVFFIAGATLAWKKFGPQILSDARYRLTADKIEVTPPPTWLGEGITEQVVRDAELSQMLLLDKNLTSKVADAFAVNAWVAEVKDVRKTTMGVSVEVEYRQPVAMVEVFSSDGKPGLYPIDREAVLLPTGGFTLAQIKDFLRIAVDGAKSHGLAGVAWNDQRITDAARVADAWKETPWQSLELYRIVAIDDPDDVFQRGAPIYELRTRKGSRIVWGHAPGREQPDEASAADKIKCLLAHAESHAPLENEQRRFHFDIRTGRVEMLGPQTAARLID